MLQSESLAALGSDQLHAQVLVLLSSFGYEWSLALVVFGIHLGLLGYLVYRSRYIPRLVGVALAIAGIGYVVYNLRPYLYPDAEIGFVFAAFFGELVFLVWLRDLGMEDPRTDPDADPVTGPAKATTISTTSVRSAVPALLMLFGSSLAGRRGSGNSVARRGDASSCRTPAGLDDQGPLAM